MSTYSALVLSDNPAAYYRLNDTGAGGIMADSAAVPHNGTIDATVLFQQPGLIASDPSDVCVDFNHAGHGTFGNAAWNPGAGPFTIEGWGNFGGTISWFVDISANTPNGSRDIDLFVDCSSKQATLELWNGTVTKSLATPTNLGALSLGRTMHLVATFDGATTGVIYVNGQPAASGPLDPFGGGPIGGVIGGRFFFGVDNACFGRLAEIALYTYALTPTQVAAHFRAGSAVGCGSGFPAQNHHQRACVGFESVT